MVTQKNIYICIYNQKTPQTNKQKSNIYKVEKETK